MRGSIPQQVSTRTCPVGSSCEPVRPTVEVVGRTLDSEHYRLRDFLTRIAQPFEWFEVGTVATEELLVKRELAGAELPIVIDGDVPGGQAMVRRGSAVRVRERALY